jgi:hypothetical protein
MEQMPGLMAPADIAGPTASLPGRRLHHRQKISTLAYVNLDHTNGGVIRDLSQAGLAVQAVTPLRLNQQVQLRFDLLRPRLHLETMARVAWADSRGQAGVQFLNLTGRSRLLLKQWIFTQLLARAHQAASMGSVFVPGNPGPGAPELLFSASPRPAIRLQPERHEASSSLLGLDEHDKESEQDSPVLHLQGFAIPNRALARIVDALILFSAVSLFAVLAMAVTRVSPSWPIVLTLAAVVTCVLAAVYWFLFAVWIGATPGARLARLANRDSTNEEKEDRPRFR